MAEMGSSDNMDLEICRSLHNISIKAQMIIAAEGVLFYCLFPDAGDGHAP